MNQIFSVGKVGRFSVVIIDAHSGNPLSGLIPTVVITRLIDNYILDATDFSFKEIPSNPNIPLIEDLPINAGMYYFDFDQNTYDSSYHEASYNAVYTATPYLETGVETYTFVHQSFVNLRGAMKNTVKLIGVLRTELCDVQY